tara:strand:+ start:126989 stop:127825 length:837 start_codon:yes stop_codon:yes gene_type:complete
MNREEIHSQRQSIIRDAAECVRGKTDHLPTVGIILGSGLGGLADRIDDAVAIPFGDIPGFSTSTAGGHRGQLILGTLAGVSVIAMAGRFHRYEGWTNDQVTFPIHVMAALGATSLIVSNAAGGLNTKLRVGDILVIRDHINLIGGQFESIESLPHPGIGRSSIVYDPVMSDAAMTASREHNFAAYEGTYLATLGPTYETRSEYRMMRRIGADVAGMSTVPEVLAANRLQMRILGLSMVSNIASPDVAVVADHNEVLQAGKEAEAKMEAIVRYVLSHCK